MRLIEFRLRSLNISHSKPHLRHHCVEKECAAKATQFLLFDTRQQPRDKVSVLWQDRGFSHPVLGVPFCAVSKE